MAKRNLKRKSIIHLITSLVIIILINFICSFVYTRIDLTSEKRYTLSSSSKDLIDNLDDVVYLKVYLEGDLAPELYELQKATKEMLDEFKRYAGANIEYEFINPFTDINNKKNRRKNQKILEQLKEKGLLSFTFYNTTETGKQQNTIFPGIIAIYKEKETAINLLENKTKASSQVIINNSIQTIEYKLASSLKKLSTKIKPQIAFIEGHKELTELETADITKELSEHYDTKRVKINGNINALDNYKAIIIAKPQSYFNEKDKFIIDQYIMKGGKVLWLIDPLYANMDSLRNNTNSTFAIPYTLNLEDQLFNYGIRINKNLIQDNNSTPILRMGRDQKFHPVPWNYFPKILPEKTHPIVKNLDYIRCMFVSSIDTIKTKNIKKTILLETSSLSKITGNMNEVNLKYASPSVPKNIYNKSKLNIATLLEGRFSSLYKNRSVASMFPNYKIIKEGKETKMIVMSDGDLIKNDVNPSTNKAFELGFDKWTSARYANKALILNTINYLLDDSGLLELRSRELQLRLLDRNKASKFIYQLIIINIVLPVVIVILTGIIIRIYRKRKYAN